MKYQFLFVFLCFSFVAVNSQSYKRGEISENTTWTAEESPFIITGDIIIEENATLTIEPGSIVYFENVHSKLTVRGNIIAKGVIFNNNFSVYNYRQKRGDSILFQGTYYSVEEYEIAKATYDKMNYSTTFMPGVGYALYQPNLNDTLGLFSGIVVEYLLYAKVGQNDNPGPSHVRLYSKLNILQSDKKKISPVFLYALGLDLSLEKNPKRTFLIPYFGLEVGGLSQKQYGSSLIFYPTVGLHLLSRRNVFINLHGGYIYPISNFETLRGWSVLAGLNFALW
jgi:hypothetical protein